MKLINLKDIIDSLEGKWSPELFLESFKLCGIPWAITYGNTDILEPEMWIYAIRHNMDKDKLVVLWLKSSPYVPTGDDMMDALASSGYDDNKCLCMVFHDIEYETIIHTVKRVFKMKLFL